MMHGQTKIKLIGYHFSLLINITTGKPGCSVQFQHTDNSVLNIQQCTVSHTNVYFSERCFKCILKSPSNYLNYKLCKTLYVSGSGLQYSVRHFIVFEVIVPIISGKLGGLSTDNFT